ncbi:ribonuclease HI [Sulfitobacter sp.]|jgi:ribonuclease HI|uniref:ribonuclease HI n=1 Tax=Sulfitobacter sp. TaxID=1903071 RepID=UPI0039E27E4E
MTYIVINADGACLGNPGPGGYAASVSRSSGGIETKRSIQKGAIHATTNNRMELLAAIAALQCIKRDEAAPITVRSDSQYLIKGMNEWLPRWRSDNWRGASGMLIKNDDLWRRLVDLSKGLQIVWEWIKGHSGDQGNEEVDALASEQAQSALAALNSNRTKG